MPKARTSDSERLQEENSAPSPRSETAPRPDLTDTPSHGSQSSDSSGSSTSRESDDSVAYHPPNLAELKAMIRSPTRGLYSGNSLLYSTSGFDMLSVITRVVTRPNPVVNLGPVDHSCSFVVVDPYTPDHEIVYCSPTFCQLTQYGPEDILRKNCRFLQSPTGQVEAGSRRIHTDHEAVVHFKEATSHHRECQVTLINYKKNGEPFLNLVTIVPITWDSDKIRYHVGFQADLVEAPRQMMENVRQGRTLTPLFYLNQPTENTKPEIHVGKSPEPNTRPFIQYTRAELLHLSKSPLVKIPDGMPPLKEWFGEVGDSGAAARKEQASDSLGQLPRDRRFRRDTEDADGARESLSSGRPTFKNPLSFSQTSGSTMGSFRHIPSRLDADARREEREREREREGRRDTENLRNLSVQFDRERRDREAAPHLPRAVSGTSATNGREPKARELGRDSRESTKESGRERRGRGDDTNDWRRARDDDGRQRSRSRARGGKGDREPANGQKRERDNWTPAAEDRRGGGAAGRRRAAEESKSKDDRVSKNDRDKLAKEEQEPAWMGDYVPETGTKGILGSGGEDSIQAWKRELKEKERGAQSGDMEALEDEGLEDEISRMKIEEEKAMQDKPRLPSEDDGLDEIQRFKKMMQESDRKRREEAERNARELAGKSDVSPEIEQATDATALPVPPGLSKPGIEPSSIPTPPPVSELSAPASSRIGGDGGAQMGGQDGSQVGTRSTSRFANFFGDKQREPTGPPPRFNDNPAPSAPHNSFLSGSNEPQLLDTLLARLAESQMRPQAQPLAQNQDRAFNQRMQGMQQAQYGNAPQQNPMNMHSTPPLIQHQHQRQQLSLHQQQQQLLSSLNASNMLSGNSGALQNMNQGGASNHAPGGLSSGILNPSLNLDIDGRFVSDNLVPGLRPRNGSIGFDEDFQVNPVGGMGRMPMQQHRGQQSFDTMHGRPQQQQQSGFSVGNRTPSGGYRNGPSPIGGHNPNPMQRAPDLQQYMGGVAGPLGGIGGGGSGSVAVPQQYNNRAGGMGNLGGMLGAGGLVNQPRFDERQRLQQGQNASIHHQSGQSLSGMGGVPLDFNLLQQHQQQQPQRQMPRSAGGYGVQQNQASMGPRNASGLHGLGAQQYPGHMHNDFVVQPNQSTNANDIMAMLLANQGNNMGA
ncbi:Zf-CCCH domain protein [Ceratobasidium sp. AG-Ba]|nr:Zf-CCCH domain protein [Ceratobasidium sp. AG-Ba]